MLPDFWSQKVLKHAFKNIEKKELLYLVLLLVFAAIPRFAQLNYSHFYGDETKTLYLDKTIPAKEFFMNQRKGPLQFFVVWGVEKVAGISEGAVRFPFAIAGIFSVVLFYFLVKKLFNSEVSFLATLLFAFNGFNVAFSRTAQYQSFLVLFGLLSLYFVLDKKYILSSIFLGLAFYAHYDALFFAIPVLFFLIKDCKNKKDLIKFIIPVTVIAGAFYIPYFLSGYLESNTINYISKRLSGETYKVNNSFYTFLVYNPLYFAALFLPFFVTVFFKDFTKNTKAMLLWFIITFIGLEFLVLNPGTHIHNYFIPLYVLASLGIIQIYDFLSPKILKTLYSTFLTIGFGVLVFSSIYIYSPFLNKSYPYETSFLGISKLKSPTKIYHLYLYGFPYNRGWDQVQRYMYQQSNVKGVYTNDNDTVAKYYLRKLNYTKPGSNFWPQYYIHIFNNQEFLYEDTPMYQEALRNYEIIEKIYVEDRLMGVIFMQKNPLERP